MPPRTLDLPWPTTLAEHGQRDKSPRRNEETMEKRYTTNHLLNAT